MIFRLVFFSVFVNQIEKLFSLKHRRDAVVAYRTFNSNIEGARALRDFRFAQFDKRSNERNTETTKLLRSEQRIKFFLRFSFFFGVGGATIVLIGIGDRNVNIRELIGNETDGNNVILRRVLLT